MPTCSFHSRHGLFFLAAILVLIGIVVIQLAVQETVDLVLSDDQTYRVIALWSVVSTLFALVVICITIYLRLDTIVQREAERNPAVKAALSKLDKYHQVIAGIFSGSPPTSTTTTPTDTTATLPPPAYPPPSDAASSTPSAKEYAIPISARSTGYSNKQGQRQIPVTHGRFTVGTGLH